MAKSCFCKISYDYKGYFLISEVEHLCKDIAEFAEKEFVDYDPRDVRVGGLEGVPLEFDAPDYVDVLLCRKTDVNSMGEDVFQRALNIPEHCKKRGLGIRVCVTDADENIYEKEYYF